jgi:hypothetical protein
MFVINVAIAGVVAICFWVFGEDPWPAFATALSCTVLYDLVFWKQGRTK